MSGQDETTGAAGTIPPANAVSVYQSGDALDAFPVLKAFQQYVDAEQAKAHKRLMSVCIFFTVLLAAVVCGFIFLIAGMERGEARGGNDATVQALTELVAKMAQPQPAAAPVAAPAPAVAPQPAAPAQNAVDFEAHKRNLELQAKLEALETEKRLREEFAAKLAAAAPPEATPDEKRLQQESRRLKALEKKLREREEKASADEKRLREKELELHRRKLYPEYYARKDAEEARNRAQDAVPADVHPVARREQPPARPVPAAGGTPVPPAARPEAAPRKAAQPPEHPAAKPAAPANDDSDLNIFDNLDLSDPDEKPAAPAAAPKPAASPAAAKSAPAGAKKANAGAWSFPE